MPRSAAAVKRERASISEHRLLGQYDAHQIGRVARADYLPA
jgi:hypothetical protein